MTELSIEIAGHMSYEKNSRFNHYYYYLLTTIRLFGSKARVKNVPLFFSHDRMHPVRKSR